MAITICTNPHAGDFDPNKGGYDADASARHAEAAHVTSWEGLVLATGEHNWHDDSDFYALVWDAERGEVRKIEYATTRGWTYHNHATVDATPEARAAAIAWQTKILFDSYVEEERTKKTVGTVVRSLTKRGKNVGVEGKIERVGDGTYGPYVMIMWQGERRFLDPSRVERVSTAISPARARELAEDAAHIAEKRYGK